MRCIGLITDHEIENQLVSFMDVELNIFKKSPTYLKSLAFQERFEREHPEYVKNPFSTKEKMALKNLHLSLASLGLLLSVCRERARQIKFKALRKTLWLKENKPDEYLDICKWVYLG